MLNVGSLFSGIGGFDLGLERAGMRTAWFCESDPFCRRVLARHWPDVPCYPDIRTLERPPAVAVLCGGFPCQDISYANPAATGIAGARSGLWAEMFRTVRDLRPRYVIVENVPALLARGLHVVLGDLAAIGFDAEWDCVPASAFGAPHQRDRAWLVAYPNSPGRSERWWPEPVRAQEPAAQRGRQDCPYCAPDEACGLCAGDARRAALAHAMAHATGQGWDGARPQQSTDTDRPGALREPPRSGRWATEPDVGRVAHGIPHRVDRLRALGNALVPQIAEWIGRRIIDYEQTRS
jgi:DNA (cytosine-5)-methyltransferase 1